MASRTQTSQGGGNAPNGNRLAEAYFRWLVQQVQQVPEGHPDRTYWDVLLIMHQREFLWQVPNDDNRLYDAKDLRIEFVEHRYSEQVTQTNAEFERLEEAPVSCLEVMIALSRRLAWVAGEGAEGWAWQLLCNLELHKMPDPLSRRKATRVEDILTMLIWRTYSPDGVGGFFPLAWPPGDQRKIEIWFQMQAYAMELHPEF